MHLSVRHSQINGETAVPGSKSHTIRALAIASLAKGSSIIKAPLVSDDTLSCLSAACAAQREFGLPILFVGLGEQPDDLQVFDPETYANAIFPPDAGAAAESEP